MWLGLLCLLRTKLATSTGPCGSYLSKSTGDGIAEPSNQVRVRVRARARARAKIRVSTRWYRRYLITMASLAQCSPGVNELFANDLNSDWTGGFNWSRSDDGGGGGVGGVGHGGRHMLLSLGVYTGWRFLFLIVGITLPLPCGVFAPTLAIGAGIGRWWWQR